MSNATLLSTRNAHSLALAPFAPMTQYRETTVALAQAEDTIRTSPDANSEVATYRSVNYRWAVEGFQAFTAHMLEFPSSGGASNLWREAARDNLLFDDKLARTPKLATAQPVEIPLTPESIEAGNLSEEKALQGRRKLRELIEAKTLAETRVTQLTASLSDAQAYDVRELESTDQKTWHLFVGAAQSAERREYCSEYDSIASDGEIPTRTQLRNAGMLGGGKGTMAVSVSFTLYVDVDDVDDPEAGNWQSDIDDAAHRFITNELDSNDYDYSVSE